MLRNDLITLLAQRDNDPVTVTVNGHAVDVDDVASRDGSVTILLDSRGSRRSCRLTSSDITTLTGSHKGTRAAAWRVHVHEPIKARPRSWQGLLTS